MSAAAAPDNGFVVEVEQEVLGTLLTGGDFRKVAFLRPLHFVELLHRDLFAVIGTAFERYNSTTVPVVAKLVGDDLAATFKAKIGIGAIEYLARLAAFPVYGAPQLEQNALKIVAQWARIALGEEAARLVAASADPAADATALARASAQAFDAILSHARRGTSRKTRVSLAEAAESAIAASRDAAQRGSGLTGITWGLADVNRLTGGLQPRDLTLIAARPGMGKSTIGAAVCLAAAKGGIGAGIVSLEMDADKLAARCISDLAYDWGVKVPYSDLIRGRAEPGVLDAVESATRDIGKLPLWIEDQPSLSMTDIRVKVEAMMEAAQNAGAPLKLLVIDHMQIIQPPARYAGNRVQEVTEISGWLKVLARELDIAVVALSQLSRAVESRNDKRPQLADLRESGSLEQDADTVVFLYREAYYLERDRGGDAEVQADRTARLVDCQHKLEFIIAKQRNGPVRTVDLFADMACSAIRNGARA